VAVRRQAEGWQNALQATGSQARKMQSAATDTGCQKKRVPKGIKEKEKL
jgi:hypothetical protein